VLIIAARTIGGPAYPEKIEEMERELTQVIEDFDCAMNFEALCLADETSKRARNNGARANGASRARRSS